MTDTQNKMEHPEIDTESKGESSIYLKEHLRILGEEIIYSMTI